MLYQLEAHIADHSLYEISYYSSFPAYYIVDTRMSSLCPSVRLFFFRTGLLQKNPLVPLIVVLMFFLETPCMYSLCYFPYVRIQSEMETFSCFFKYI